MSRSISLITCAWDGRQATVSGIPSIPHATYPLYRRTLLLRDIVFSGHRGDLDLSGLW